MFIFAVFIENVWFMKYGEEFIKILHNELFCVFLWRDALEVLTYRFCSQRNTISGQIDDSPIGKPTLWFSNFLKKHCTKLKGRLVLKGPCY